MLWQLLERALQEAMTIFCNSHDYQRTLRKELVAHLSSNVLLCSSGNQTHNLAHTIAKHFLLSYNVLPESSSGNRGNS